MLTNAYHNFLFIPAIRLDLFAKAVQTGVDTVIIDLEDTVAESQKQQSRDEIYQFDQSCQTPYWLRINGVKNQDYAKDVALITQLGNIAGVLLPKVQNAANVEALYQAVNLPILAAIEDAQGVANIANIATAQGLYALTYGCLDLAKNLGVRLGSVAERAVLEHLRVQLLIHSRVNHLHMPIEGIFADFKDDDGLRHAVKHWQDFGFGGQLLIHPRQVAIVQKISISEDDIVFAKKVIATYHALNQTIFQVDGKMVDLPIIHWAQDLLDRLD